jgi:hypothetical protein
MEVSDCLSTSAEILKKVLKDYENFTVNGGVLSDICKLAHTELGIKIGYNTLNPELYDIVILNGKK